MNLRKIALVLLIGLMLPGLAFSQATDTRVFDRGNLLTVAERQALTEAIAKFQQETGMDFVFLTSNQAHGDVDAETIADDFYDKGGFGLDGEHSGVLYYIDMYERYQHLSTTGAMIDYLTDERIENLIDDCKSDLSAGDYSDAAQRMLRQVRGYIQSGIPEGQYQYDVLTGERLTARHKRLTTNEMLVCAAIALAIGFLCVTLVTRRYQLKGSTYRYALRDNVDVHMTDTEDTFLRTTTTRTPKPRPSDGFRDGGGGFGGGGGSGVHTGSSGTSHGGGGGHF